MSNLLYLFVVVALSGIGGFVLWLRHRRPKGLEAGIEEFSRELRALSPERQVSRWERRDRAG